MTIYKQNTQSILVEGFADQSVSPPAYVNNATFSATLLDPNGNHVTGLDGVAGAYVAASNGDYQFPIGAGFNPPAGGGYVLVLTGTAGSDQYKTSISVVVAEG